MNWSLLSINCLGAKNNSDYKNLNADQSSIIDH